jgi:hypothetical protein
MVLFVLASFNPSASQKEPFAMGVIASRSSVVAVLPCATQRPTEAFHSAEEAWFWTMAALTARRDGARYTANQGRVGRPCEPDDVVRCLDALYRRRRIDLVHARILRIWGERRLAPNPAHAGERCDWRLWREAIDRLEWPLRMKGIVA